MKLRGAPLFKDARDARIERASYLVYSEMATYEYDDACECEGGEMEPIYRVPFFGVAAMTRRLAERNCGRL